VLLVHLPALPFWHHIRAPLRRSVASADLRLGNAGELLETGVAGVVMLDISWCGGLSEARKIAAMAEAWHLPVAPHDCTGPVVLAASTHLSLNAPNALVQESVRAFYHTWYRDLVTAASFNIGGLIAPTR
jgi:L-alanine-DL-glutamate epimerase-like enolase superfamily enzyme